MLATMFLEPYSWRKPFNLSMVI